jgi:class 3 adenylate cyclase
LTLAKKIITIPEEFIKQKTYLLVSSISESTAFIEHIRLELGIQNFILSPVIYEDAVYAYLLAGRSTEGLQYATRLLPHHAFVLGAIGGVLSAIKNQLDQNIILEQKVTDRTVALNMEMQRSENLLLNILPLDVANELKLNGFTTPKYFDQVTVLLTDFVNFTTVAEKLSPEELVGELDICFRAFDEIIVKYKIEKIKTIGDAYLAVCGLPIENDSHAVVMVRAAKEIRDFMVHRKLVNNKETFGIRLGIHTGPVVAGVVGSRKFAYDIWGDTVNTAARMEQNSESGKINISAKTFELVKDEFECTYRGDIEAKNKGMMKMYFLN